MNLKMMKKRGMIYMSKQKRKKWIQKCTRKIKWKACFQIKMKIRNSVQVLDLMKNNLLRLDKLMILSHRIEITEMTLIKAQLSMLQLKLQIKSISNNQMRPITKLTLTYLVCKMSNQTKMLMKKWLMWRSIKAKITTTHCHRKNNPNWD